MQFAVPPRVSPQASTQNVVPNVPKSVVKAVGKQLTQLGLPTTSSKKKDADGSVKVITRRDYQTIISLRLAGRSNKEIAKKYGKPLEKIRGHIERAMAEFRKGSIRPEAGGVAGEARNKGKDKSLQFVEDFQNGLQKVELLPTLGDGGGGQKIDFSTGGNLSPDAVQVDFSTADSSVANQDVASMETTESSYDGASLASTETFGGSISTVA